MKVPIFLFTVTLLPLIHSIVLPETERTITAFAASSLQPAEPASSINTTYTLPQELSSWADLTILTALISLFPDLGTAAKSEEPFLLFAPTNDAFISVARALNPDVADDAAAVIEALAGALDILAELPDGVGVLEVLQYHLVAGNFPESDIRAAETLETLQGTNLVTGNYPLMIGDVDPIFDSKRLGRQIATANGRISIIDNVLLPLNVADTLSAAGITLPLTNRERGDGSTDELSEVFRPLRSLPDFITRRTDLSILATLAAGSDTLLSALTDAEALHVFAPNDAAFLALVKALIPKESIVQLIPDGIDALLKDPGTLVRFVGKFAELWGMLDDVPTLEEIVTYHILSTESSFSQLAGTGKQETVFGGDARLEITDGAVRDDDSDRGDANLIASYPTGNGFVSIIDGVLLPFPGGLAVEVVAAALGIGAPEMTSLPEPEMTPEAPTMTEAFTPASLQPSTPASAIVSSYDLVQELSAWKNLTVLLQLLTDFPDLIAAASSDDPFLVFAPTNDAFLTVARVFLPDTPEDADADAIVSALGSVFETLNDAAPDLPGVMEILTYHLVSGDLPERNITVAGTLETVLGESLGTSEYPRKIQDVDPTVDSKRLGRQIATTNGRVSFVDNVLIPFNVADALSSAGVSLPLALRMGEAAMISDVFKPFQSLVDFVTLRTDLIVLATLAAGSETLQNVLSTPSSLHVFAPTDSSFLALAKTLVPDGSDVGLLPEDGEDALGNVMEIAAFADRLAKTWALLEGVPSLEQIVSYHVLNTSKSYEDLVGDGRQVTLLDGEARIEVSESGVSDDDEDRDDAPLIASFATGNGFVSVIDGVLLPFPASTAVEIVASTLGGDDGLPATTEEPEVSPSVDGAESTDEDDATCFPAHATVQLEDGTRKRMDELYAGDSIAVSRDTHSAVYLFTHRLHKHLANFVRLETDCNRSVTLTPSHYVYADGILASAGTVRTGELLETDNGICKVVQRINVVAHGLFAPHTMHGDLVVDGVRVSSYSTAVEPRLAHFALSVVRGMVRLGVKEPLRGWFDEGAPRLAALLPGGYPRY